MHNRDRESLHLSVQAQPQRSRWSYHFVLQWREKREAFSKEGLLDPGAYLERQFLRLPALFSGGETLQNREDRLRGAADRLTKNFLPRELAQLLGEILASDGVFRDPAPSLHLVGEPASHALPWELFRIPTPAGKVFLAERFAVTRWLPRRRSTVALPMRHLGLVVSPADGLAGKEDEEAALLRFHREGERHIEAVGFPSLDRWKARCREGRYDAWHFIAHGPRGRGAAEFRGFALGNASQLTPDDLSPLLFARQRPLVFLNACHSAGLTPSLVDWTGFATAFLEAGVGGYIGATWAVPSRSAANFARLFYHHYLDREVPLGEALRCARRDFGEAHPGDPTRLAYLVYAHSLASLRGTRRQVFLSHRSEDSEAARHIIELLRDHGIEVWADVDRAPQPRGSWIHQALKESAAYVFLLGSEHNRKALKAELRFAAQYRDRHPTMRISVFLLPAPDGRDTLPAVPANVQQIHLEPEQDRREATLAEWAASLPEESRADSGARSTQVENPFPGLEWFEEEHEHHFFGRDREVGDLVGRLGNTLEGHRRWLQIEGASGAGKSSLARAGLLPCIRRGWVDTGRSNWRILKMRPGQECLTALADEVTREFQAVEPDLSPSPLAERFRGEDWELCDLLRRCCNPDENCLLLIDQLEELFTLCPGEAAHLDRQLTRALADGDGPLYLVTTVRIDFLDRFPKLPGLSDLLNDQHRTSRYTLKRMDRKGLEEVLHGSARAARVDWAPPNLPETLLEDADDQGGNLPLLACTLQELWEREGKREGVFRRRTYEKELGRLGGALTRSADQRIEEVLRGQDDQRGRIRELFLALVQIEDADNEERTRAVRQLETYREVWHKAGGDEEATRILTELSGGLQDGERPPARGRSRQRLIVVSGQEAPPGEEAKPVVELAHEALLTRWITLAQWIETYREALGIRDQLERQARLWQANGGSETMLPDRGLVEHYQRAYTMTALAKRFLKEAQRYNDLRTALAAGDRLRGLFLDAEELWPAHPDQVPQMDSWLRQVEAHRQAARHYRRTREEFHSRFGDHPDDPDRAWQGRALGRLLERLEELDHPDQGLLQGLHPQHGWGVAKRRSFAATLEELTVGSRKAAELWNEARAAIADRDRHPAYDGLELPPQVGLLPIGPDPDSGLWEFVHIQSGTTPVRTGKGKLVPHENHGLIFVLMPPGEFRMGATAREEDRDNPCWDEEATKQEGPPHRVQLDAFFLSKYEMTQAQWKRAQGSNPGYWNPEHRDHGGNFSLLHPVENISWLDCRKILRRLTLDLPTEAQWEYACRAGSTSPYPRGSTTEGLEVYANVKDQAYAEAYPGRDEDCEGFNTGHAHHSPVGSFRPNAFGLHDMHGNIWEWCRDAWCGTYQDTTTRPGDGLRLREGPSDPLRVCRGGSFFEKASHARASYRTFDPEDRKAYHLGVRPARPIEPMKR